VSLIEVWIDETERRTWFLFELGSAPGVVAAIVAGARTGDVILLYSSHDTEHNNAVVLRDYVREKIERNENAPSSHSGRDRDV
jgi:hypothetical protein